ncbi:MAG: DUF4097 family beta strand repeat-containing protein [Pseudomonadales bacterium]
MIKQLLSTSLLGIALAATFAHAERQSVDETRAVQSDGFVRIAVVRGNLKVEGWDRDEIRVRGELDERTREFIFDVQDENAFIEVRLPRSMNSWCCEDGSDLTIQVPTGSHVDVTVVSTDVTASNLTGSLKVGSISGDVRVSQADNRVDLTSVSGDLHLHAATGRIELRSVSGDLDAAGLNGTVRLQTVSGDIDARDSGEELVIESVSGDIDVVDLRFSRLSGHTVSGDSEILGELIEDGSLEFDSVSGSIRVGFKGNVNARFDVETGSGSIRNRISRDKPVASKYVRDETLRFVVGDGTGEVILSTRSGDIVISRD